MLHAEFRESAVLLNASANLAEILFYTNKYDKK
jgi:hypothetical protein